MGKRSKGSLLGFFGRIFFNSIGLPLFLSLTLLAMLFVLFRMKGVELDYEINRADKNIAKLQMKNKDLRAQKAKLLSPHHLRDIAKQYDLNQPKQEQIIVVQ